MSDVKKWDKVDNIARAKEKDINPQARKGALEVKAPDELLESNETPTDIVTRYKANKIKRNNAIEQLSVWYDAQLEITKTHLKEAVIAKKEQIGREAQQFITELDRRHLEFLAEIGLKNKAIRESTLIKLADQTKDSLSELESRRATGTYPDFLINETIEAIINVHRKFFEKLQRDDFSTEKKEK